MTKEDFTNAIVSMVVKNCLPFSFFSSSPGFQAIAGPIAKKLMVSLDKDAVRHMVMNRAQLVEQELITAMKNQPVFLKMDSATRKGHS